MTARSMPRGPAGFTLVELLVATGVVLVALAIVLPAVDAAQTTFHTQGEAADLHQRLRASIAQLASDLRTATAVRPYRTGLVRDDSMAGVFYRGDTITALGVPASGAPENEAARTYYLKSDPAAMAFQLMQYDGESTDLPVVEHVVALAFDYLADEPSDGLPAKLPPGQLTDGPWLDDASGRRYDADLLRVTLVRIRMRLESADASTRGQPGALFMHAGTSRAAGRLVPDAEIELDVAVRNLRRDP